MKSPSEFPTAESRPACPASGSYPPHRLRPIDVLFQLAMQPIQLLIELRGECFQTLPIHTSTAPVGLHLLPGHLQVLPLIHLVHQ